jgi:hypothetical protein
MNFACHYATSENQVGHKPGLERPGYHRMAAIAA